MEKIGLAAILSIDDIKKWNQNHPDKEVKGISIKAPEKAPGKAPEPEMKKEKEKAGVHVSEEEKKLLAQLVHSEAKGEPYEGKVAVASVVLNRVESKQFPDTVKDVIYEKNAFSPVGNGSIHEKADKESIKAAEEALQNQSVDYLYFFNPDTAESEWIKTRKVEKTIGNHSFSM
ncbi:cell wall hydrolase [Bacillus sp. FJAT-42376]|nr:cell wall hydrolase [Bacillus sp. FJAT-42376]